MTPRVKVGSGRSDAAGLRIPDEFVHLQLHAHLETIRENPLRQLVGRERLASKNLESLRLFERRGHQYGGCACHQIVCFNHLSGPVIIGTVGDDEFDLVGRSEIFEILHPIPIELPGPRSLQVEDSDDSWITRADVNRVGRFNQNGSAGITEFGHQRKDGFLSQRFSAGEFDQSAVDRQNLFLEILHGDSLALLEGVFRVAVVASQRASGEPHEDTGGARTGGFALDRVEDFVDANGGGCWHDL